MGANERKLLIGLAVLAGAGLLASMIVAGAFAPAISSDRGGWFFHYQTLFAGVIAFGGALLAALIAWRV